MKNTNLARVLEWKFGNNPDFGKGISIRNDELVGFHPDIAPWPTDAQLAQWTQEFEALPNDDKAKDPKADLAKRIRALSIDTGLKQVLLEMVG